jgi:predicted transcriptional regulator
MLKDIADELRKAIRDCGESARTLEKETGVPHPTITRFLAGADMRISRAAKIAAYLGMELKRNK